VNLDVLTAIFAFVSLCLAAVAYCFVKPDGEVARDEFFGGAGQEVAQRTPPLQVEIEIDRNADENARIWLSYKWAIEHRTEALNQFRHQYLFAAALIEDDAVAIDRSLELEMATLQHAADLSHYREPVA
jgi:hypothetical protein